MGDEYSCLNVEYILVCCSSYTKVQWKTYEKMKDKHGIDVDVGHLESCLEITVQGDTPSNNVTYLKDETWEDIKSKIGKIKFSECDCAVFIFLGFLGEDLDGEESIIVKPEREAVKTNDIIDYVKRIEGLYGKPKVFIIQADDPSLMPDKVGPIIVRQQSLTNMTEPVKETKIPVDADRLIIKSTIPQQWSRWLPGDPGSLLIKAFCDIVVNNPSRIDLLSLTTDINDQVKTWIRSCKANFQEEYDYGGDFFNKFKYPLCSSTLRKLLYFGTKTQDNVEIDDDVSNHSGSDEGRSNTSNPGEEDQFGSTFPTSS